MWRRNDGFFLAELLLTLSAWLVIASVFFPLIIDAVNKSMQLRQEYNALQLLYENLIEAKKEGVYPNIGTRMIDRTSYEMALETSEKEALVEVCIKYEDILRNSYKKCEIFE